MKAVQFAEFGLPQDVADCVEVDDPGAPVADEVVVEVEAFPINPVDLLTIEGRYASRPDLPAIPGSESVGRIAAVGHKVADLAVGDRVINLGRNNWVQKLKVNASSVIKVPQTAPVLQLAMLKVNPASAFLMLRNYVTLEPGDWIIQNAANSGVGTYLIRLAQARGLHSVNLVRRDELIQPLKDLGADVVIVDGPDLGERVAEATGGADIKLAIDAVAGEACQRLAECLAEGGTVVNYGLLSGQPCTISPHQVVFRDITLTGFWLVKALGGMAREQITALYSELAEGVVTGHLESAVEATYSIQDIDRALAHAGRRGRGGKILVTPNGPLP